MTRWQLFGAIAFLVSGIQYLLAEAIAASAWTSPPYSYAINYISDLGVPGCPAEYGGRAICSPLAPVMNAGFLLEGVLFSLASIVLFRMSSRRVRVIFLTFALVHGIGIVLVALFNEAGGVLLFAAVSVHVVGATMAIVGGNIAIIVGGFAGPVWFRVVSWALGGIGLVSVALLEFSSVAPDGILERGGVYPVTVWQILVGVSLLAVTFRRPRAPARRRIAQ